MLKVVLFGILYIHWCSAQQPQQRPADGQPQFERRAGVLAPGTVGPTLGGSRFYGGYGGSPDGSYGGSFDGVGDMYQIGQPGQFGFGGGLPQTGFGGGFRGQVSGGQGLRLEDIYNLYGGRVARVDAAVISSRDVQVVPVPSQYQEATPIIVDIDPIEQPIVLNFGSRSSSLFAIQSHVGQEGSVQRTRSEDRPHYIIHEVIRPVIQEVREVIQPQRRIIQEITPIVENVQTIVARGEGTRPQSPLSQFAVGAQGGGTGVPGLLAGNGGPIGNTGLFGGAGLIGYGGQGGYVGTNGIGGGGAFGMGGGPVGMGGGVIGMGGGPIGMDGGVIGMGGGPYVIGGGGSGMGDGGNPMGGGAGGIGGGGDGGVGDGNDGLGSGDGQLEGGDQSDSGGGGLRSASTPYGTRSRESKSAKS